MATNGLPDFSKTPDCKKAERFKALFAVSVAQAIRNLLQSKHLYQSLRLDSADLLKRLEAGIDNPQRSATLILCRQFLSQAWSIRTEKTPAVSPQMSTVVDVDVSHAKLYCETCARLEPFNVERFDSLLYQPPDWQEQGALQVLALSLRCQSCKGTPEVFLLRREDDKVQLSGRAPMEFVPVPDLIPRSVRTHYSNAIIAFQSRQTLSALFQLRTLIEQWLQPASTKCRAIGVGSN